MIKWLRGSGKIQFNTPSRYFCLGITGSAKSSFLETIGEGYLNEGHTVLDLFGSRDGEGLAWLRSKWAEEKRVLILHGDNVDLETSHKTMNVSKLSLNDFEKYDLILSGTPCYVNPNCEFIEVNHILDLLYQRLSWKRLVYAITREAANLFYSRLRANKDQLQAKAEAVYLVRESRHMGLALGLDSLKYTSIDIDMRYLVDYQVIKQMGMIGLPDDLSWLYHMVRASWIRKMDRSSFLILTREGSIGIGAFSPISWHKQEGENILKALGIKREVGEAPELGEDRRTFKTIGDAEHSEIMTLYIDEKQSMAKIHTLKNRSPATIKAQIDEHNAAITRSGFCPKCKRVNGVNANRKTNA
jgi:hypothetical protein